MGNQIKRRDFISTSAKGTLALSVSMAGFATFLQSCNNSSMKGTGNSVKTGMDQTPLPYAYNALEPVIDAQTMELHYSKHAAGYSKKLQEAVKEENVPAGTSVEDILANTNKYSEKMRNNAGGHYNHEFFWKSMRAPGGENKMSEKLSAAIVKDFGSVDAFKTEFNEAGKTRFGSGWAWLYQDSNKVLKVGSTPNQDNPLMDVCAFHGFPLLGVDVWEHAYYLKYQNKRADYLKNWWDVVNWEFVSSRFT